MLYIFVIMPSADKLVKTAGYGGDESEDPQRRKECSGLFFLLLLLSSFPAHKFSHQ